MRRPDREPPTPRRRWRRRWLFAATAIDPREGLAPNRDVLSMSLFGTVSASFRGRPIDLKLRKGAAILGYLCLQENFVARRDRLAFLLWSESDGNSARTSLRQTLIMLRKAFEAAGCDALRTTKLTVGLDPEALEIDVRRVLATTEEGRIDEILLSVELLPETLLEGMEDLDEEFRTWLLPTRQALHNRLEASLSARLNDAATSEPVRVQAARALLCIDPTNENALRHEVVSFAKRGDIVGALRSYRRFEKLLAKEYGVKPSAELQMLITRVQREAPQHDILIDLRELDKIAERGSKRDADLDAGGRKIASDDRHSARPFRDRGHRRVQKLSCFGVSSCADGKPRAVQGMGGCRCARRRQFGAFCGRLRASSDHLRSRRRHRSRPHTETGSGFQLSLESDHKPSNRKMARDAARNRPRRRRPRFKCISPPSD